jgi:hypothetical protein
MIRREDDMIQIAVINESTVVSDPQVKQMVDAIQVQVDRDWTPVWGIPAQLVAVPRGQQPATSMWWQGIFDNADQAGALGYHDLTTAGLPIGKVFAKTTLDAGDLVSVTLSHEVLEMLGDPDINLIVQKGRRGYAYEVCDAVEDDSLGYDINGVRVSDFVYPQYFETFWKKGATKFDHLGHLKGPLPTLTHGGYIGYLDFTTGQWNQLTARLDTAHDTRRNEDPDLTRALFKERPQAGARRYRRALPPATWLVSTVKSA